MINKPVYLITKKGDFLDYQHAENNIKKLITNSDQSKALQNIVEYLYTNFDKYSWVGIYIVEGQNLILGPWIGKQATEHTTIPIGKGICGAAAATGETEVIADVAKDERYLACFTSTRSEIVVPIKKDDTILGEIDIDSDMPNAFDEQDKLFLEITANILSNYLR